MAPPPAQNPQLLTSCEYASRVIQSDRKSTRLNSSHLVISYAVFCLKKKKNKQKNSEVQIIKENICTQIKSTNNQRYSASKEKSRDTTCRSEHDRDPT